MIFYCETRQLSTLDFAPPELRLAQPFFKGLIQTKIDINRKKFHIVQPYSLKALKL